MIEELTGYIKIRFLLSKYQAIEKGTFIASEIVVFLLMIIIILFFFLFAGIALACFLTRIIDSSPAGFGCITLFYLLIGVLSLVFKRNIKVLVMNTLIKKILKK